MKNSKIFFCNKCGLHRNQKPLLDKKQKADVMWVGLSAKKVDDITKKIPLDNNTNSGRIIEEIENQCKNKCFYKTNLVKCLPLDEKKKLRYPSSAECSSCFANLKAEIQKINPRIVILLGVKVADFVLRQSGFTNDGKIIKIKKLTYLPVPHPSYIAVYKRKEKDKYIQRIKEAIELAE